jgi:RNA polymerase sigma-70 factor (ECF subfamily)
MGIATNVLRNTTRAARRHDRALARMPARDSVPDFAEELVGRMADADQLAAAQTALAALRRSEREVFTLCVWSGLGYAEAAEALGIPVGTVRSRLSRARTRLRGLADLELKQARGGGNSGEPPVADGQVRGGRTDAARSTRERNR